MDLFYPDLAVQIGQYTFTQGISITVCSSCDSYFDWAKIRFTAQFEEQIQLSRLAPAEVLLGYGGSLQPVFKGMVTHDFNAADNADEVLLQYATIKLDSTEINHVFISAQPAEVIRYCCNQSRVLDLILPTTQYPQMNYPVVRTTALKAIQGISKQWRIPAKFYMLGDAFAWNPPEQQTQMYLFEYQRNIISLAKTGGMWVLETVSVPFIKHSIKIAVQHPAFFGVATVSKIIFESNAAGFLRTKIYFKG